MDDDRRPVLLVGSKQTARLLVEIMRRRAATEERRLATAEEVPRMFGMFGSVDGASLFGPSLRGPRRPSSSRPRPGTEEAKHRLAEAEEKRARKAARRLAAVTRD